MTAQTTRRKFLVALSGGAAIATIALRRPLRLVYRQAAAADDTTALSEDELHTVLMFAAVLLPSGKDFNQELEHFANDHTRSGAFREAVQLLNARSTSMHQTPFAALDPLKRDALVRDILAPASAGGFRAQVYARLTRDGRQSRHVWSSVVVPILVHFYSSRLGWGVVGYSHRPGECSNLTDYQEPPVSGTAS